MFNFSQHLAGSLFHHLRIDQCLALDIGTQHGTVTQHIDEPRDATGELLDFVDRTLAEYCLRGTADLQTVFDIGARLFATDRIKVVTCRHPLGELPHIFTRQQAA